MQATFDYVVVKNMNFLKVALERLKRQKKMTESGGETSIFGQNFGRSGETQTRGPRIPNAVRYQLRHTPIYSIFSLFSVSVGYYVVVALL